MNTPFFQQFPATPILPKDEWTIIRITGELTGVSVSATCAVRGDPATLEQALSAQGITLTDRHSLDTRVEQDGLLVKQGIANGSDLVLGPLGIASPRDGLIDDLTRPSPEILRLGGVNLWSSSIPQQGEHALPTALDQLIFEGPSQHPKIADRCFAVLDAARIFGLPERLAGSGLRHACLFKANAADDWANVAPWLVEFTRDDRLARTLFTEREDHAASPPIIIRSPLSFEGMYAHLRTLTMVIDPSSGRRLFFRYYDPITVRTMLVDMPAEPLQKIMRGMACLYAYGPDGDSVLIRNMHSRQHKDLTITS